MSLRVAVVEDHKMTRESLAGLLRLSPSYEVVGVFPSGEAALAGLPALKPDVVLMDLHLPGMSGIECIAQLRAALDKSRFLMLTIDRDGAQLLEALSVGADGYLLKNSEPAAILRAIEEVAAGGSPMSSHMARLLVERVRVQRRNNSQPFHLSPREEEIVSRFARGARAKEVADELNISIHTVRAATRDVYAKLGARSTAEAVAIYLASRSK